MQSAPSIDRVLAYLNRHGHSYANERALVQACRDNKTFMALLKDLLQQLQYQFIRTWMATQGYTFSQDSQRSTMSLAILNDYLAHTVMLGQLKLNFRLGLLFSKNKKGEHNVALLGRIIGFLEAKERILAETQNPRVQYQLMLKTYKNVTQLCQEKAQQKRQVQLEKQRERPLYEKNIHELNQLIEQADSEQAKGKRLNTQIYESQNQERDCQKRIAQGQRTIEETEIKIAQHRRELIKFAPDIKRERQHLDVKLNQLKSIINFKRRIWDHLKADINQQVVILEETKAKFDTEADLLNKDAERCSIVKKEIKEKKQYIMLREPDISENSTTGKILEAEIEQLDKNIKLHERTIMKENQTKKEVGTKISDQTRVKETMEQANKESQQFRHTLDNQKRDCLFRVSSSFYEQKNNLEAIEKTLQDWERYIKQNINEMNTMLRTETD